MGKVVLAFLAVYLVWGSTYFALARGVETIPPLLLGGLRYTTAGLILTGVGFAQSRIRPQRKHWFGAAVLGFLFFLCANGGVTWAESHGMPSSAAALLCATSPLFTIVIAALFPGKSKATWWAGLGLLLGFVGVALLVMPPGRAEGEGLATLPQTLAVLLASLAWSFGSVIAPRLPRPNSMSLWAGLQMLVGGFWMLGSGAAVGELSDFSFRAVSPISAVAILYLVIFGSLIAFSAFNFLLKEVGPTRTSTYAYVNPVVAVALGWAFGGEPVGLWAVFAMVLILLGVGVTQWQSVRSTSTSAAAAAPSPTAELAGE